MRLKALLCCAATFAVAQAATIDNFSTTQSLNVTAGPPPAQTQQGNVATGANAVGGTRAMVLNRTSGEGVATALVNNVSFPGALALNSDVGTNANLRIIWDGGANNTLDNPGFAPVDLTDGGLSDRIRLGILSADLGFSMVLRAYSTVASAYYEWNFNPAAGASTQNLFFAGASLVGAPAGLNSIRAVELLITTPTAGDIAIDFIESFGNPPDDNGVPEPATFVLAGAGLAAVGLLRRKS